MLYKRLYCIVLGIFILFSLLAKNKQAGSTNTFPNTTNNSPIIHQELLGREIVSFPDSSSNPTILLQEVVVNAYQINTRLMQVPGSISLISGKDVNTADGNNLSNTLHSIPGVYMHSGTYATSRIIIRGVGSRTPYNTNRIKSYINDIPLTSSDGISTPEDIDLSGIGRIEIIKGPASALYGSGLGGSINLFTPSLIKSNTYSVTEINRIRNPKSKSNSNRNPNTEVNTNSNSNSYPTFNSYVDSISNSYPTSNSFVDSNLNSYPTSNSFVDSNSKINLISSSAVIQYGEFNTLKGALGLNYYQPNFGITANLSHLQSDGYRQNNHIKRTSLISAGQWQQNNYSLEYTFLLTDMNAGIPSSIGKTIYETNPSAAAANWNEIGGFKDYQRGLAGLTIDKNLSPMWNNRLTVFGRWVDSYEKRPFNNLDDSSVGGGVRNKLTFHSSRVDMLLGLEWISDKYRWQMDLNNDLINKNAEVRNHLNIFGMAYYRPAPKWNISFGGAINNIRYRLTDEFPEDGDNSGKRNFPIIFSPRLGVNYLLNSGIAFYASIGHGFSMPSPEETLLPEGNINENIKPEQGIQYEAGVRLNLFKNATQIEISTYLINLNNLLVTKRLTEDIFTGINAGETRHSGIEIMLNQQVFRSSSFPGNLQLNTNYTFSRNKFIDFMDDGNSYNGHQLPGIPSHIAQVNLRWNPIESLELYIQTQKVSSQYMNDANTLKNEGYIISNLKLTYNIYLKSLGTVSLFSGINNAFNEHYAPMITVNAVAFGNAEPRYYYPGMPRHWYSGLSWNF